MCRYTVYCKGFPIISTMRFDYKKVFCKIGVKVCWCVLMETYGNLTLGWHHLTMSNSKLFMDQRWSAKAPGLQDWRKPSAMASRNSELRQSANPAGFDAVVWWKSLEIHWKIDENMDENGWTSMTSREPADVLKLARGFRPLFASVEATGDRFDFKETVELTWSANRNNSCDRMHWKCLYKYHLVSSTFVMFWDCRKKNALVWCEICRRRRRQGDKKKQ